jgi:hypothetical protein
MQAHNRTSAPLSRRPLIALAVVAGAWGGSTAVAEAATQTLRPDNDAVSGWQKVEAPSAWEAIDDPVASGSSVPATDLIKARRGGRITVVDLADPAVPEGEAPAELTAHLYAGTGRHTKLRVQFVWNGRARATRVIRRGSRARWRSLHTAAPDEGVAAGMQLRFRATHGRKATVRAAYADLRTRPLNGEVSVFGSNTSLRPDLPTPPAGRTEARLSAAQNEFESFQVAVESASEPIDDLRIEAPDGLSGPGGASIPADNLTVYREEYYDVSAADGKPRSSRMGASGRWPDALIPERDPYYGEDRSAFPVDVPAGSKALAWIDVFVPADTPPGEYSGTLRVTANGAEVSSVPVRIRVIDHKIPSTSSMKSAFLMNPPGYFPCRAHQPVDWCYQEEETSWKLDYLYSRAALENRVTIPNAVPGGFAQTPDEARFVQYLLPLINGSDDGGIDGTLAPRLHGAELTTVSTMWQCVTDGGCLSDYRALATEHGFADKFVAYVCDEPSDQQTPEYWNDWRDCRDNARQAEQRWPGISTLVTSTIQSAKRAEEAGKIDVSRDIDVLVPPINYLANRVGNPQVGDQRPAYDDFLSDDENEAWTYTYCAASSCDELEAPYFDGWPAYAIDQPASQARSMSWIAYYYDLDGELYYNTTLSLDTAWRDQYRFGANGDGTLFYPGSPSGQGSAPAIGGQHDIPIESIRLKRIRDGREDYELMNALSERGQGGEARAIVADLVGPRDTATFNTDVLASEVDAMRCSLLQRLDPSVPDCAG